MVWVCLPWGRIVNWLLNLSAGGSVSWQVLEGDCLPVLRTLEPGSVQTCVTSPPYWGLRDYGTATWEGGDAECDHTERRWDGPKQTQGAMSGHAAKRDRLDRSECECGAKRIDSQLGLEPTPEEYVQNLVEVFREVRRVLRDDGTVWLNLGDSYAGIPQKRPDGGEKNWGIHGNVPGSRVRDTRPRIPGLKVKDLVGIPWRVAFALQADGWWLRSDIIWAKPNPMPESVTDRPTRAHEYVFLLSKSARYFYDADAIREADLGTDHPRHILEGQPGLEPSGGILPKHSGIRRVDGRNGAGRNKRSVWEITTQPYSEAHFATFPPKLVEPCILAGSPPKCCGECGAPWERVMEDREVVPTKDASGPATKEYAATITAGTQAQRRSHGVSLAREAPRTIAWTPGCSHGYENLTDVSDSGTGSATVLDPFCGSGTTGLVALRHNRSFIGIELNPTYAEMARNRIRDDAPLMNHGAEVV